MKKFARLKISWTGVMERKFGNSFATTLIYQPGGVTNDMLHDASARYEISTRFEIVGLQSVYNVVSQTALLQLSITSCAMSKARHERALAPAITPTITLTATPTITRSGLGKVYAKPPFGH